MVRRKGLARGLAQQLQRQLMMPSPSAAQCGGWLTTTPQYARNYQLLHWQHQTQPSSLGGLCNKMSGCLPRMAALPQPEVSSRKLSRLRRNLMTWQQPELLHVPQRDNMLPQVLSLPVSLPQWCRANDQLASATRGRQQAVPRIVDGRQPGEYCQPAKQLKRQQQMQLWHRQQWLQAQQQQQHQQQQQRWQQPATAASAATKRSNFQSFNFGKWAEIFINFHKSESESTLYAAAHSDATRVAATTNPVGILKNPLERCEDFSYVKVAKQMVDSVEQQKRVCNKLPVRSAMKLPSGNETSPTTLTNATSEVQSGGQAADNPNARTTTARQMTLQSSEESLNQLAADIDVSLTAIRRLLELQLPQKCATQINAKELDSLATLLQQRTGVNSKPGIHLKGGESQISAQLQNELKAELQLKLEAPTQPQTESVGAVNSSHEPQPQVESVEAVKSSHERQLNLNKWFQQPKLSGGESDPMWETLMHLAARMCQNKDESAEQPPKQYSVYLMVNSDDENDTVTEAKDAQQIRNLSAALMQPQMNNNSSIYPTCIPDRTLNYKMWQPSSNYLQWQPSLEMRKKKRTLFRKRRDKEQSFKPWLPPRRPLHWPKLDYSKLATMSKKKLLRCTNKFSFLPHPLPLRKCHYRWP